MNVYLITQLPDENGRVEADGYDTFDGAVVVAESAEGACKIHPGGPKNWDDPPWVGAWASSPGRVQALCLGPASAAARAVAERDDGVILASFHAG